MIKKIVKLNIISKKIIGILVISIGLCLFAYSFNKIKEQPKPQTSVIVDFCRYINQIESQNNDIVQIGGLTVSKKYCADIEKISKMIQILEPKSNSLDIQSVLLLNIIFILLMIGILLVLLKENNIAKDVLKIMEQNKKK